MNPFSHEHPAPRRPEPSLRMGLVGPSLAEIIELIGRPDFGQAFPGLTITGLVARNQEKTALVEAEKRGIPVYARPQELAAEPPDLVVNLLENGEGSQELRSALPPGVSVLHHRSADKLWSLLAQDRFCKHCQQELQDSQELFTLVIDQLEEDILLLDPQGRILDMNKNVYAHRKRSKKELLGLRCWDLEGDHFCCQSEGCTYKETASTGKKAERLHTLVDPDGRVRYWRIYTYPVFDSQRRLTHILEVRRDITNRMHMEMRLQQSEKLAAIGELATYIAHEIRNPLFAIGGFANALLRSEKLDEDAREKVGIVLQESKRLDGILKSILNFSRPTQAQAGHLDLNQVVRETTDLLRIGFESLGGSFRLETSAELPMVKADGELIKQCLINLIKNAMEAMPEGGDLTVRTGLNGRFVRLEVEDQGPGIPRELLDKVFNPFFSTKDKGAGLGLAMTKKIVEDMGGRVELSSQPGQGTRVSLFLPPVLAVDADTPAQSAP